MVVFKAILSAAVILFISNSIKPKSNLYFGDIPMPTFDTTKQYNDSGVLEAESIFDDSGKLLYKTLFYSNGKIKSFQPYKDGMLHGEYQFFGTGGALNCFIQFYKGQKHGHYFCYKEGEGYCYIFLQHGERMAICMYSESGGIGYYEFFDGKNYREAPIADVPDSLQFKQVLKFLH